MPTTDILVYLLIAVCAWGLAFGRTSPYGTDHELLDRLFYEPTVSTHWNCSEYAQNMLNTRVIYHDKKYVLWNMVSAP